VDGNPARSRGLNLTGLERRGFSTEDVRALKEAYKCIHLRNLNLENALNELTSTDNACVAHLVEFYKKTQRGVC
jgi:UDP-N-acetylglucosamine acyltransferase